MIALYARVSTKDKNQDPQLQLGILRAWAERQGRADYVEYVDYASGKDLNRPSWRRMVETWRTGVVDTVAVVRLDRAFRSIVSMHHTLDELSGRGIRFAAATQDLDTQTPAGKLLLNILASMAEFERDLIIERVNEGIANARKNGVRLGRPKSRLSSYRANRLLQEKMGDYPAAAAAAKVSESTLRRRIRESGGPILNE